MNEQATDTQAAKPGDIEVNIKAPKVNKEVNLTLNFGDSLNEMVENLGEDVVFSLAQRMIQTDGGNRARSWLNNGDSEDTCVSKLLEWQPGVAAPRATSDPIELIRKKNASLSPEQRAQLIQILQS